MPTGTWTADGIVIEAQGIPYKIFSIEVHDDNGNYTLAYHETGWYVNGWPPTRRASVTEIDGDYWFSMDVWNPALGIWVYGDFVELAQQ